jgi:hypothetical protein
MSPRSPDTPSLPAARDDQFEVAADRVAPLSAERPLSTASLVAETVELMNAAGESAEQKYQSRLDLLRERAGEVVSEVGARYDALEEDQYLERWSVVQLLTDLRRSASVNVLEEILRRPIPPERSPDPAHGFSTVGEETIIRTTAVEALARLAADGDQRSKQALLGNVRHPSFSVRRAAVQAIVDTGDADLVERARRELADTDDRRLFELRRVEVQSVPQAEGGRFLKQDTPPPPDPAVE